MKILFLILISIFSFLIRASQNEPVLEPNDLVDNKIFTRVTDIDFNTIDATPYWHCFNPKLFDLNIFCLDWGKHETEGAKGMFGMRYKKDGIVHEFLPRHAEQLNYCVCKAQTIRKIKSTAPIMCILAEGHINDTNDVTKKKLYWVLRAIKSKSSGLKNEDDLCDK